MKIELDMYQTLAIAVLVLLFTVDWRMGLSMLVVLHWGFCAL